MNINNWKPYCFEDKCIREHIRIKPTHGSCCTCQDCGQYHDGCICQYFEEPCISCEYIIGNTNE
jgi:hypothetical protein